MTSAVYMSGCYFLHFNKNITIRPKSQWTALWWIKINTALEFESAIGTGSASISDISHSAAVEYKTSPVWATPP